MPIFVGDVIGCCQDLEREVAWYTKNSSEIPGLLVCSTTDTQDSINAEHIISPSVSYECKVLPFCTSAEGTFCCCIFSLVLFGIIIIVVLVSGI